MKNMQNEKHALTNLAGRDWGRGEGGGSSTGGYQCTNMRLAHNPMQKQNPGHSNDPGLGEEEFLLTSRMQLNPDTCSMWHREPDDGQVLEGQ
jgi:hypothetical protein